MPIKGFNTINEQTEEKIRELYGQEPGIYSNIKNKKVFGRKCRKIPYICDKTGIEFLIDICSILYDLTKEHDIFNQRGYEKEKFILIKETFDKGKNVKGVATELDISETYIRIILKENNIDIKDAQYVYSNTKICDKECLNCNDKFEICNKNIRQKFCCKKCRELYWIKNNPERDKFLKKKSRQKKLVLCKNCHNPIPNETRKSGLVFCSESCRKERKREVSKDHRSKIMELFSEYKRNLGCCICGYNKNAAALDFHHVNPKEKERKISAGLWYSNKELFRKERAKCILICSNCHRDIHSLIRRN